MREKFSLHTRDIKSEVWPIEYIVQGPQLVKTPTTELLKKINLSDIIKLADMEELEDNMEYMQMPLRDQLIQILSHNPRLNKFLKIYHQHRTWRYFNEKKITF